MNPYGIPGIFQSQANQGQNSFTDPQNIAGLYPGWGVDPNQRTPAYDAPYRPAYQGPNPYAAYQKPSFMGGISQLYNPFYKDPYWSNPISNNENAFNSLGSKPFDGAMNMGQNFIAPAVVYGVSQALLGGTGAAMGKSLGFGLSRGLGSGFETAGMMGRGPGSFIGRYGFPIAVAQAAMHVVEQGIYQPYIRSRQMADDVQENFAGITFAGGGNVISGRGLSGAQSAAIGSSIDRMGMKDMTFSANQYNGIASMSMRSGLFDDVGGGGDITKRVSSIAAQIKSILAISKDPNVATAIEELAKLRLGGAGISGGASSQAASAYGAMGMAASVAGVSVQQLMGRVGNQGQYMYQMNGLTPYLGQLAAGNAYSGFASAQRMGLLSTAQLARMGGLDGATQSALGAQLSASSTMFNRMGLMNQFVGGGQTNGVTNTVSNFGALAARNPLGAMGAMSLYGGAMASQQALNEGPASAENQAVQILRSMGRRPGSKGFSPVEVAAVMESQGIPSEQIQAYFAMRSAQTNPANVATNARSIRAQSIEQMSAAINQGGLSSSTFGTIGSGIRKGFQSMYSGIADDFAYPVNSMAGKTMDAFASGWNRFTNGDTFSDYLKESSGKTGLNLSAIENNLKSNGSIGYTLKLGERGVGTSTYKVLEALDKAARSGGQGSEYARKLLEDGFDGPNAKDLFIKFMEGQQDPALRKAYESMDNSMDIFDRVAAAGQGQRVPIVESDRVHDSASAKIGDQAAEVHSMSGLLSRNLEKTLDNPKYAELKSALMGTTGEARTAKVRNLVLGKLSRSGVNINNLGSREDINAVLGAIRSGKSAQDINAKNSKSDVDYGSYNEAMKAIDSGSRAFVLGVSEFRDGVREMRGLGPLPASNNSGQKTTGFNQPLR